MNNEFNIAVVGLGQIGSYLLNELNIKKKDILNKTGKKINIVAISAKNKNKKRPFKINKKIFYSNPLNIIKDRMHNKITDSVNTFNRRITHTNAVKNNPYKLKSYSFIILIFIALINYLIISFIIYAFGS